MARVDYDRMAPAYDAGRSLGHEAQIAEALRRLRERSPE